MNNNYEITMTTAAIQNNKVSHLLHLFLSIITCGLWLVIWIIVTLSVSIERKRLSLKLKKLMKGCE
jgi:hypothetical protein